MGIIVAGPGGGRYVIPAFSGLTLTAYYREQTFNLIFLSTYFHSHLNSAISILQLYKGEIPFHLYLKRYFAANKKFGSKDRKQVTSLCYHYFRLGHAVTGLEISERILTATFLCESESSPLLQFFKPEWNSAIGKTPGEKLVICNLQPGTTHIFPFEDELSPGIDPEKFNRSFLIQPKLFLRVRPGNKNKVIGKLAGAGVSYELLSEDCIALPNSSKINGVLELDKEAVVQDYNSQRVGEFMKPPTTHQLPAMVWDCCAASGGKSLMAYDIDPGIQLTVSDKRETILKSLEERFAKAGVKNYESFITDLSLHHETDGNADQKKFDLIIADVPCTGSGTWSRTPEQLCYFSKKEIERYSHLQKQIIENIVPHLKPGAILLYITCSVFKKENEALVDFAVEKYGLTLEKKELLSGYEMQADTMFAALLKR